MRMRKRITAIMLLILLLFNSGVNGAFATDTDSGKAESTENTQTTETTEAASETKEDDSKAEESGSDESGAEEDGEDDAGNVESGEISLQELEADASRDNSGSVVYVGTIHGETRESNVHGTTPEYPFQSIQDAYDALGENGGTIYVVDEFSISQWASKTSGWTCDSKNVTIEGYRGTVRVPVKDSNDNVTGYEDKTYEPVLTMSGDWVLCGDTVFQYLTIRNESNAKVHYLYPDGHTLQIGSGTDEEGVDIGGGTVKPKVRDTYIQNWNGKKYRDDVYWLTILTNPSSLGEDKSIEKVDIRIYGSNYINLKCDKTDKASLDKIWTPNLKTANIELVGSSKESFKLNLSGSSDNNDNNNNNALMPAYKNQTLEGAEMTFAYVEKLPDSLWRGGNDGTARRDKEANYNVKLTFDHVKSTVSYYPRMADIFSNGKLTVNMYESSFTNLSVADQYVSIKEIEYNLYNSTVGSLKYHWHNNCVRENYPRGYYTEDSILTVNLTNSRITERLETQDKAVVNVDKDSTLSGEIACFSLSADAAVDKNSSKWNGEPDTETLAENKSELLINLKEGATITMPQIVSCEGGHVDLNIAKGAAVTMYKGEDNIRNITNAGTIITTANEYWSGDYKGDDGQIKISQGKNIRIGGKVSGTTTVSLDNFTAGKDFMSSVTSDSGAKGCISWENPDPSSISTETEDGSWEIYNVKDMSEADCIYLREGGSDNNDGSSFRKAVATVDYAYKLAKGSASDGGNKKIVLCGSYFYDSSLWKFGENITDKSDTPMVFTSNDGVNDFKEINDAKLIVAAYLEQKNGYGFSIQASFDFEDVKFTYAGMGEYYQIYCNGYKTIIGDNVEVEGTVNLWGGTYTTDSTVVSTDLTVRSGTYVEVSGGAYYQFAMTNVKKVDLKIYGGTMNYIFGGHLQSSNKKTVNITVDGSGNTIKGIKTITGIGYNSNSEAQVNYYADINMTVDGVTAAGITGGARAANSKSFTHGNVTMTIGQKSNVTADGIYAYAMKVNSSTSMSSDYTIPGDFSAAVNLYDVTCKTIGAHQAVAVGESSRKNITVNYCSTEAERSAELWQGIGTMNIYGSVTYTANEMTADNLNIKSTGELTLSKAKPVVNGAYTAESGAIIKLGSYTELTFNSTVSGTTLVGSADGKKPFDIYAPISKNAGAGAASFTGLGETEVEYETKEQNHHWYCQLDDTDRQEYVYVDGTIGDDAYNGASAAVSGNSGPVKTVERAYELVCDGGTIIISGKTGISSWPNNATRSVTLTSDASLADNDDKTDYSENASLTFTPSSTAEKDRYLVLWGNLTLKKLTFYYDFQQDTLGGIDANGYRLIIGDKEDLSGTNVRFYKAGTAAIDENFMIVGGGVSSSTLKKINLQLYNISVSWVMVIYGGNLETSSTTVNGDVNVVIEGCDFKPGYSYAGARYFLYCGTEAAVSEYNNAADSDRDPGGYGRVNGDVTVRVVKNDRSGSDVKIMKAMRYTYNYGDMTLDYINKTKSKCTLYGGNSVMPHAAGDLKINYDGYFTIYGLSFGDSCTGREGGTDSTVEITFTGQQTLSLGYTYGHINQKNIKQFTINLGTEEKTLSLDNNNMNFLVKDTDTFRYQNIDIHCYNLTFRSAYTGTSDKVRFSAGSWDTPVTVTFHKGSYTINQADFANNVTLVLDGAHMEQLADTSKKEFDLVLENGGTYTYKGDKSELKGIRNLTIEDADSRLGFEKDIILSGNVTLKNGGSLNITTAMIAEGISGDGILDMEPGTFAGITKVNKDCSITVNYNGDYSLTEKGGYGIKIMEEGDNPDKNGKETAFKGGTTADGKTFDLEYDDSEIPVWTLGSLTTEDLIYLNGEQGDDTKSGTSPNEAEKTLEEALRDAAKAFRDGSETAKIVLCGKYTFGSETVKLSEEDKKTLDGRQVIITQKSHTTKYPHRITVQDQYAIPCGIIFQNITLGFSSASDNVSPAIYADGYPLTIGVGVETSSSNSWMPSIYGGNYTSDVNGDIALKVYSGQWYRIYGGGYNGNVTGDISITLGDGEISPVIFKETEDENFKETTYAVFGGGTYGDVTGKISINVKSGTDYNYIFGGSLSGKVTGDITVRVDNKNVDIRRIYGGSCSSSVDGTANVLLKRGTVNRIYGGGVKDSTDTKNTNVVIGSGSEDEDDKETAIVRQYLRGSGDRGAVSGTATLTIKDGALLESGCSAAAGGYMGGVGKSVLNIEGGEINCNICAGGYGEFKTGSNTEINTDAGNVSSSELNITGGTVDANVFAGGNMGYVGSGLHSDSTVTTVNITGGTVTGNVYGGCNMAVTYGNTEVSIRGGDKKISKVFGGGKGTDTVPAEVTGETTVNVAGSGVTDGIFGGCDTNGTVATANINATEAASCDIFGAGYGVETSAGTTNVVLNNADEADTDYDVYGGGEQGCVTGSTNVTIKSWYGNVFGGGKGAAASDLISRLRSLFDSSAGLIDANVPKTNVSINGTVYGNVYGGGELATVGSSDESTWENTVTNVTVHDGSVVKGNIYGGGKGDPDNKDYAVVYGCTSVSLLGGTIKTTENPDGTEEENGAVFGGGQIAPVAGNTNVIAGAGEISRIFGGNDVKGEIGGTTNVKVPSNSTAVITELYGGGHGSDAETKLASVTIEGGEVENAYAGGKLGETVDTSVTIKGGEVTTAYAGGNAATVTGTSKLTVDTVDTDTVHVENVFAGNNSAAMAIKPELALVSGKIGNVYGGGNEGVMTAEDLTYDFDYPDIVVENVFAGCNNTTEKTVDVTLNLISGTYGNVYGGNHTNGQMESTNVVIDDQFVIEDDAHDDHVLLLGNVYGGGDEAASKNTTVTLLNYTKQTEEAGKLTIYGGGNQASADTATVMLKGGWADTVYGGGCGEKTKVETTNVNITKGNIEKNVYGGSESGRVGTSNVVVRAESDDEDSRIVINGSVFGAGYGVTSVAENTNVTVDLPLQIDVDTADENTDLLIESSDASQTTDSEESSGATNTVSTWKSNNKLVSTIVGNVYGGGDMGTVGKGTIKEGNNAVVISQEGSTNVQIEGGYLQGNVFGGGNGVPTDAAYTVYMGAVFGSSSVNVKGGYIEGSVYGCGNQSRSYAGADRNAATLNITEDADGAPIVIGDSIFAGGDKGSGTALNASVYTVIGNTTVNIKGEEDAANPTAIYMLSENEGGVYGDGRLCLVQGTRTVNIENFNCGTEKLNKQLKTFYSMQRADVVNLVNTRIVLEGAKDLVDEDAGTTLYSINRVGQLNMYKNSAVKMTTVVNLLGGLSSDENTDTVYIDKGNNGNKGEKNYTKRGGEASKDALTEEDIAKYQSDYETFNETKKAVEGRSFNVVCVANGQYLEIKKSENQYGNVTGLFTLQLLHANKGEGGGFVYANIGKEGATSGTDRGSTGDFICVTKKNSSEDSPYMDVVDDVGGYEEDDYTYYFWYIKGGSYNYDVYLNGYIGSTEKTFSETVMLTELTAGYNYVLKSVTGDDPVSGLTDSRYYNISRLQSSWTDEDEEADKYAIELKIIQTTLSDSSNISGSRETKEVSLGYLHWDADKKCWAVTNNETTYYGVQTAAGQDGYVEDAKNNTLYTVPEDCESLMLKMVLHKGAGVDVEIKNVLNTFTFNIDGEDHEKVSDDDEYQISVRNHTYITQIVPTQDVYMSSGKLYAGVTTNEDVKITSDSAFTVQYITRYVPSAFPKKLTETLTLEITEKYLWSENMGVGFTVTEGDDGSVTLNSVTMGDKSKYKITKEGSDYKLSYKEDDTEKTEILQCKDTYTGTSSFPAGTAITLVAKADDNTPTFWYYYCSRERGSISLSEFVRMNTAEGTKDADTIGNNILYSISDGNVTSSATSRVTESMTFVVDFSNASAEADKTLTGCLQLKHTYTNASITKDIMDYVSENTTGDADQSQYERMYPVISGEYEASAESDGIKSFELKLKEDEENSSDKTRVTVDYKLELDSEYLNTRYEEGEYSIRLTPKDGGAFPAGTQIFYNGEAVALSEDNLTAVIPIKTAGSGSFVIQNKMQTWTDVTLEAELFSSKDAEYYNSIDTGRTQTVSFDIEANSDYYALRASVEETDGGMSRIVSPGGSLNLNVETETTISDDETEWRCSLYKYNKGENGGSYSPVELESVFETFPDEIAEDAPKGTYRLEFTYGDKTAYLDFIVK